MYTDISTIQNIKSSLFDYYSCSKEKSKYRIVKSFKFGGKIV